MSALQAGGVAVAAPAGAGAAGRRMSRSVTVGLVGFGLVVLVGLAGPVLLGERASEFAEARLGASMEHPLGTDGLGRDLLARTLVAARTTVLMALGSTALAAIGGTAMGTAIAIAGRRLHMMGSRAIELMITFPPILVAIVVVAVLRPSAASASLAIGLAFIPAFARLTYTLAASVAGRDYVDIAKLLGLPGWRVASRHVVPNIASPLLVLVSVAFSQSIVVLSALSYLGLGVQAPAYDWGSMLSAGLDEIYVNPIHTVGPAVGIVVTGVMAGLVADGVAGRAERTPALSRRMSWWRGGRAVPSTPAPVGVLARSGPDVSATDGLRVRDLEVRRPDGAGLVRGVSLDIDRGEIVGLVGESGSGKSLTALALAGLHPRELRVGATQAAMGETELLVESARGQTPPLVGMVFQDPAASFNPALRLGTQLTEAARVHRGCSRAAATDAAADALAEMKIDAPRRRLRQYPHELSGGMRQRAMLAMAVLNEPPLLVADEPTTALDVTVQAEVLDLLRAIARQHNTATLLISHDIGVVTEVCDRVLVMYAGRIVERTTAGQLYSGDVAHPYTTGLLDATPRLLAPGAPGALTSVPGRPPAPGEPTSGCAFAPRCALVEPRCLESVPELATSVDGHLLACHVVAEGGASHA